MLKCFCTFVLITQNLDFFTISFIILNILNMVAHKKVESFQWFVRFQVVPSRWIYKVIVHVTPRDIMHEFHITLHTVPILNNSIQIIHTAYQPHHSKVVNARAISWLVNMGWPLLLSFAFSLFIEITRRMPILWCHFSR